MALFSTPKRIKDRAKAKAKAKAKANERGKPRDIVDEVDVELGLRKRYPERYLGGGKWAKPSKREKPANKKADSVTPHMKRQARSEDDRVEVRKMSDPAKRRGK